MSRAALPLILASKSASRRAMLDAAGVAYESIPADIDERAVEAGLAAKGIVAAVWGDDARLCVAVESGSGDVAALVAGKGTAGTTVATTMQISALAAPSHIGHLSELKSTIACSQMATKVDLMTHRAIAWDQCAKKNSAMPLQSTA